ncbi:MAG: aminotransferase class IV [Bacteriovoracaceae bacterium]|nr:aminotransferase class IV [Bacteriovoracaceae bacterium]
MKNLDALICINGKFTPPEEATVSVFDRGFLYGDSVYEVTLTYDKVPYLLETHLERLERSALGIGMELEWSADQIKDLIYRGLKEFDNDRLYIRIMVTRGCGEIGLDPSLSDGQNLYIIFRELKPQPKIYYIEGVSLITAGILRNPKKSVDPNVKSGNYLNNVLAISQAKEKGAYDAIMLNASGNVTESTTANIWIVENDTFITPPLEAGLLGGITRATLIEIAQKNDLPVKEENFTPERMRIAQEVFITSSTREVMPVTSVDGQGIGNSKPGEKTKALHNLYRQYIQENISQEKKKAPWNQD